MASYSYFDFAHGKLRSEKWFMQSSLKVMKRKIFILCDNSTHITRNLKKDNRFSISIVRIPQNSSHIHYILISNIPRSTWHCEMFQHVRWSITSENDSYEKRCWLDSDWFLFLWRLHWYHLSQCFSIHSVELELRFHSQFWWLSFVFWRCFTVYMTYLGSRVNEFQKYICMVQSPYSFFWGFKGDMKDKFSISLTNTF